MSEQKLTQAEAARLLLDLAWNIHIQEIVQETLARIHDEDTLAALKKQIGESIDGTKLRVDRGPRHTDP